MGRVGKFVDDKSYQVISYQAVNNMLDAIEKAKVLDGVYPKFIVTIEGSSTVTVEIPQSNVPEIVEVLKLCSADPDD